MADSFYGAPTSPPGPAPPPPPKPYSDASRTGTPIATGPQHQNRYSQHYSQPPPLPQPQSPSVNPQQQYRNTSTQYYGHSDQNVTPAQSPMLPQSFDLPESITKQSTADLSKLLSEPELLNAVAQNHPAYATSLQPLQHQISQNVALASQVASAEAQLKALREKTGQLMLQHTSLQTQWRRKQAEMDEALAPWGPRAMYQRLTAGISEQENMLLAVQESFLDGSSETSYVASEKEVTDWVKRIREGATLLEKRRETRARWDEGRVGGWR